LNAFLLCLDTGTAPAVGYSRTLTAINANDAGIASDWTLLESQAASGTNINLVAKGTIDGQRRGLLYQPGADNYKLDSTNSATLTRAELVAKISAGDRLTIMGVPPGSGHRMGIDRNLDGVLDADEPLPSLRIAPLSGAFLIQWPSSAAGFKLQQTPILTPLAWSDDTNSIEVMNGYNFVTNQPTEATTFFRLQQ
jgi:hypothetical protein